MDDKTRAFLFWGGVTGIVIGVGAPLLLPHLPASIQSNATLQPIGAFLIDYGNWIALFGLLLGILGMFL
jgi:hypothetical protein